MTEKNDNNKILIVIIALTFLLIIGLLVSKVMGIPGKISAKLKGLLNNEVYVYEETIDIEGLEEPFTIYFVADSHISLCDERDSEMMEYCKARYEGFKRDSKGSEKNFSIVMDYVRKQNPDLVIFGGDITDAGTYASVEYATKEIQKLDCPYLYVMGNHDFMYINEFLSDKTFNEILPRYDAVNEVREGVEIKEYEKFDILILDDYNCQFSEDAPAAVEKLKQNNKPVIVAQHVPYALLYNDSDLIERSVEAWGSEEDGRSRVLIGNLAVIPNDTTSKVVDYVFNDRNVKLVLAGHLHFLHHGSINGEAEQIVAAPAFERGVVKITLK